MQIAFGKALQKYSRIFFLTAGKLWRAGAAVFQLLRTLGTLKLRGLPRRRQSEARPGRARGSAPACLSRCPARPGPRPRGGSLTARSRWRGPCSGTPRCTGSAGRSPPATRAQERAVTARLTTAASRYRPPPRPRPRPRPCLPRGLPRTGEPPRAALAGPGAAGAPGWGAAGSGGSCWLGRVLSPRASSRAAAACGPSSPACPARCSPGTAGSSSVPGCPRSPGSTSGTSAAWSSCGVQREPPVCSPHCVRWDFGLLSRVCAASGNPGWSATRPACSWWVAWHCPDISLQGSTWPCRNRAGIWGLEWSGTMSLGR